MLLSSIFKYIYTTHSEKSNQFADEFASISLTLLKYSQPDNQGENLMQITINIPDNLPPAVIQQ